MPDPHGLRSLVAEVLAEPRRGAHERWQELLARLRLIVRASVLRLVGDEHEASNFAQEVLIRVHRGIDAFHGTDAPALVNWVMTIARHLVYDRPRRPGPARLPDDLTGPTPPPPPDPERIDRVLRALERLRPDWQRILRGTFFEGRKNAEIGACLSPPRTAEWVATNKTRAIRELKLQMGAEPC